MIFISNFYIALLFSTVLSESTILSQSHTFKQKQKIQNDQESQNLRNNHIDLDTSIYDLIQSQQQATKCDQRLFELIGMQNKNQQIDPKDVENDKIMKKICPQISSSCCTYQDFEQVSINFREEANNVRESFDLIEETLSLLKGPKFQYILDRSRQTDKCDNLIKEIINYQINYGDFEEFKKIRIQYMYEELSQMLEELPLHIENIIQLYGNVSCTVCNTDENRYITIKDKKAKQKGYKVYQMNIKLRFSNCLEIIQAKKFIVRLEYFFVKYLQKFSQISLCLLNKKPFEFTNDDRTPNILYEEIQQMSSCILGFYKEECLEICSLDSILSFQVPHGFFTKTKEVLKVMYNIFTDKQIEDYYINYKGKDFKYVGQYHTFNFYKPQNYKVNIIEKFSLHKTSGISITNDKIGQMFLSKFGKLSKYTFIVAYFVLF